MYYDQSMKFPAAFFYYNDIFYSYCHYRYTYQWNSIFLWFLCLPIGTKMTIAPKQGKTPSWNFLCVLFIYITSSKKNQLRSQHQIAEPTIWAKINKKELVNHFRIYNKHVHLFKIEKKYTIFKNHYFLNLYRKFYGFCQLSMA